MASKVKPRICRTNEISIPIDTEECVLWLNPVQSVDDIKNPTRDYAWITPDNTVYVFNGHKIVPIFSTNDSHIKWGHFDGDIKDQKDLYEILLKTVNGVKQNGTELPKDLEQKVNVSVPIMHIKVNNTELEPNDYTVNIDLTSYAQKSEIPTNLSQLTNDVGYITPETESDSVHTITFNGNLLNPDAQKNITINVRTFTSTSVSYQISDSKSTAPTGDWVTSVPTLDQQHPYLWTKFVHTYSDNTSETSYTIATTLDGIQVGGRNLLLNTKEFSVDKWKITGSRAIDSDGFYYCGLINSFSNYIVQEINKNTIYANDSYIVSFYAKAENDVVLEIKNDSVDNYELGLINIDETDWKKYILEIKFNKLDHSPQIAFLSRQNEVPVYIKSIKLEHGNTPTDWTPAPEDLEAYTDTKATEINNTLSTYAKKTDVPTKTSQLTNDSGYITSAQRIYKGTTDTGYEGTGWVDGDLYVQYVENEESIDFSETVTKTGRKWIDGKPIYKKVIKSTNVGLNNSMNISHGISNIKEIVKVEGIFFDGGNWNPLPQPSADGSKIIGLRVDNSTIRIVGNDTYSQKAERYLTVIIYFTATTD